MKLALLKGNRFNPWHLSVFPRLRDTPSVTAFRAESEIQSHFSERDDGSIDIAIEHIHFDTQAGSPVQRFLNVARERYFDRRARILPFHERLKDFDLVQSWELFTDWTAEAVKAKRRYDVPLAIMVWDNIPFNMESTESERRIKTQTIECADRFIVHTERSARMLDMEGVPEQKVVHVNPGVDTDAFRSSDGEKNVRADLGLADDEFVILFVGWLLPRKGIDFLLMAVRELLRDRALADVKLKVAIVGAGPGKPRVEGLIRRLGIEDSCLFLGAQTYDKMPGIFRASDVFVLPSIAEPGWQEQFGMSLIEAMSSGVPVVASLSGAIAEVASDAAILCQPNDFLALHESIRGLILDESRRNELGRAGRARALSLYNLDAYAAKLSDVYAEILRRG